MNASTYAPSPEAFLSSYLSQRLGIEMQGLQLQVPEPPSGEALGAPSALAASAEVSSDGI